MFNIPKLLDLPKELLRDEILPYVYCQCENCKKKYFFFDFSTNVCMRKYRSVFDDDFYIRRKNDEVHEFSILCNNCYVNFLDNLFYRIKD